jgi:hypothetical protein
LQLWDNREPPGDKTSAELAHHTTPQTGIPRDRIVMALIVLLLMISASCWAVVLWDCRTRSRLKAREIVATEFRRTDPDGTGSLRRDRRSHLRLVSSKQR